MFWVSNHVSKFFMPIKISSIQPFNMYSSITPSGFYFRLVFYVFIFDMEITSFLEVIPVPVHNKEEGTKARQGNYTAVL